MQSLRSVLILRAIIKKNSFKIYELFKNNDYQISFQIFFFENIYTYMQQY